MSLPKPTGDDQKVAAKTRDPFPDEILTDEEKNHSLTKYKDIAPKLEEIRKLHLDGILFDASQKSNELMEYIKKQYPSTSLADDYLKHPRRISIETQLKETNRMLEFMTSDDMWHTYKDDGTWKTEWMTYDTSDFQSFRLTGIGDVPLYNLLAVIYEMDLMKTWMPLCKESKECGQMSLHCKCGYMRIGLFWPIQDRECILFGYGVDDLKNGRILIYFDSREDHDTEHIKIDPCPKGRCRVDIHLGGFYFERLTDNTTKITCVWNSDPKMNVPVSIINWFAGTFAGVLMSCIVSAAKFDNNSEYQKRIDNNHEFYGMMKERLAKSKTTSQIGLDKDNVDQKQNDLNDDDGNNDKQVDDDNKNVTNDNDNKQKVDDDKNGTNDNNNDNDDNTDKQQVDDDNDNNNNDNSDNIDNDDKQKVSANATNDNKQQVDDNDNDNNDVVVDKQQVDDDNDKNDDKQQVDDNNNNDQNTQNVSNDNNNSDIDNNHDKPDDDKNVNVDDNKQQSQPDVVL